MRPSVIDCSPAPSIFSNTNQQLMEISTSRPGLGNYYIHGPSGDRKKTSTSRSATAAESSQSGVSKMG
jgi:hypothetical protein